jgi:hypothetical protein
MVIRFAMPTEFAGEMKIPRILRDLVLSPVADF